MGSMLNTHKIITIKQFNTYSITLSDRMSAHMGKEFWLTNENYCYFLGEKYSNRWVLVPKGYASNGADTPKLLQGLFPIWSKYGACVILHDYLCEYGFVWERDTEGNYKRIFLTRKQVDEVFLEALKVVGINDLLVKGIEMAFAIHRFFADPKIPNVNEKKLAFENILRKEVGWNPPTGDEIWHQQAFAQATMVFPAFA